MLWSMMGVMGRVGHHHHVHGGAIHLTVLECWLNVLSMVMVLLGMSGYKVVVVLVMVVLVPHLMQAVGVPLGGGGWGGHWPIHDDWRHGGVGPGLVI